MSNTDEDRWLEGLDGQSERDHYERPDLRQRIEQRITDLRVERDIAAAAVADQPSGDWRVFDETVMAFDGHDWTWVIATMHNDVTAEDLDHIATQDPAATIARIDRELAGCAADLALLDWIASFPWNSPDDDVWMDRMLANIEARYPSEESS